MKNAVILRAVLVLLGAGLLLAVAGCEKTIREASADRADFHSIEIARN